MDPWGTTVYFRERGSIPAYFPAISNERAEPRRAELSRDDPGLSLRAPGAVSKKPGKPPRKRHLPSGTVFESCTVKRERDI